MKRFSHLVTPVLVLALTLLVVHAAAADRRAREAPWPIRLVGGVRLAWTPELAARWTETMRCTGLRPDTADPTLALWRLDAAIPVAWVDARSGIGRYEGLYLPDLHAVFVYETADTAVSASTWRHEFVHAALRADTGHGPVFTQYAAACGLNVLRGVR